MTKNRTLYDKIWDDHVVEGTSDGKWRDKVKNALTLIPGSFKKVQPLPLGSVEAPPGKSYVYLSLPRLNSTPPN